MKLVFIVAALALLKIVSMYRVVHRLPLVELKRRARGGDQPASALYKIAADEKALDGLLFSLGFIADAFLVIAAARYSWWLACLVIAAVIWLIVWAPSPKVGGPVWRLNVLSAPLVFKVLSWLHPALDFLGRAFPAKSSHFHSGAYETEDLIELIKNQTDQPDNRVPEEDLKIAVGALTFGAKTVSKVMTPRRAVKFVSENDLLGPLLLDDLYKTGLSRFPVAKGSAKGSMPEIVGTLYLRDIVEVGQENKGTVKEHMKKGAYFINESCDLRQALDAILASQHHQLVVVNNFEEMVGVITLEDILEQIIGQSIVDEFDKYDDLRAVAQMDAEKEKAAHKEVAEPKPAAETDDKPSDEMVAPQTQ